MSTRQLQNTPTRLGSRRRSRSSGLSFGVLASGLSIGVVLILVSATFIGDLLRTPDLTLSASPLLLSPNGDQTNDGTSIAYTLSEEANVTVEVFNEGGTLVRTLASDQPQSAGQHIILWDGLDAQNLAVADGRYRVQVTAQGTARAARQSIAVEVDTQPPGLRIANLGPVTRVRETGLSVEGLTDPEATIWLAGDPQPIVVDGQGRFTISKQLIEGSNILEVLATDPAGNTTRLTREVVLVTDPPDINIATPLNDEWLKEALITIAGAVPPGTTLAIDDQPVNVGPDGAFEHDLILQEGDNIIKIEATDDVGNVTTQERIVHVKTTPPSLSLNVDEGTVFRQSNIQLTGHTDPATTVLINNQPVAVSALGEFQTTLSLLAGENTVTVEARDRAGNTATLSRRLRFKAAPPESDLARVLRGFPQLPPLTIPILISLPLLILLGYYLTRPVSLVLASDQNSFTPGLPEEGKVLILSISLSKASRATIEVLDEYNRPLATILHRRQRGTGEHRFYWNGYDDHGRVLRPGSYVVQAKASTPAGDVTSAVPITIEQDPVVHGRYSHRDSLFDRPGNVARRGSRDRRS
ncbi:MAG: FlgD immunoglobulin-like domain containing protein [Anaerolineae bacterium]